MSFLEHVTHRRNAFSICLHTALMAVAFCAAGLFFYEQQQSKRIAAQFKTAVRGAGAGQWYWDIEKNSLRWDDRMFELFHCSKSGWANVDGVWEWRGSATDEPAAKFAATLYSEDTAMVMAALQRAVMTKGSYQAVFRIKGTDGAIYFVRAGGAVYGGGRYMTGLCLKFTTDVKPGELDVSSVLRDWQEHMEQATELLARRDVECF